MVLDDNYERVPHSYTVAFGYPTVSLVSLSVVQVAILKGITVSLGGVNMLLIQQAHGGQELLSKVISIQTSKNV